MPWKPCHPPVSVQVRAWLAEARSCGMEFDDAWAAMLRRTTNQSEATTRTPVYFPHATIARHAELEALEATKPEWCAAYIREPTRLSTALERALQAMDDIDDDSTYVTVGVVRQGYVRPCAGVGSQGPRSGRMAPMDSSAIFTAMLKRNDAARRDLQVAA